MNCDGRKYSQVLDERLQAHVALVPLLRLPLPERLQRLLDCRQLLSLLRLPLGGLRPVPGHVFLIELPEPAEHLNRAQRGQLRDYLRLLARVGQKDDALASPLAAARAPEPVLERVHAHAADRN